MIIDRWQAIHSDLHLYQYDPVPLANAKTCPPILMIHSFLSGPRSWEPLSEYFQDYGLEKLYAMQIPALQVGDLAEDFFDQLHATIQYLLKERHPKEQAIILIGHGVGGLLAYRYWQHYQDQSAITYLFMIGAPHDSTVFPLLAEEEINNLANKAASIGQDKAVDFCKIRHWAKQSKSVLVNIVGHQVGPDFYGVARGVRSTTHFEQIVTHDVGVVHDGLVRGLRLPEAINLVFIMRQHMDHRSLNKDKRLFEPILAMLRGEFYQVKLYLIGLRLRGVDDEDLAGPIAFEINGNHMPPDSIFQGVPERLYLFEENAPPLCVLHYPVESISCVITLHLKDLSNQRGKRRRMYTRLYIPLHHSESIAHTMQDSEGSEYIWRITTEQVPRLLEDPALPDVRPNLSRGI